MKYLYHAYMESSFFQTLTPKRKALLLREEPCLNYSNDLFDNAARKVWDQILSFWEQSEKGRELLEQPYSATFKIADYVLGFSPSSDVYRFPRSYAVSPDICQPEEEFVLGNPVEARALASQLGGLKIGQVWFLEEPGEPSAGIYNRYHLCVVYIGGGIFLLPINQRKQHFLNANDFLALILNVLQFNGKYQWRSAMIRTSDSEKPFSLKIQEAYPVSVTDFLYK
ncbi:hypothetical protein [Endozoicomonas euniceicola]|uniref:Uncharacterized protein n=1 Tax=Endozoicomonas euniceicola TaxID=1234143 RepID=A0ABY6GS71_9GAMM|nr:hypothetical protein [Endozoicomonas euniceicola]UYM14981.1 hypothetical protein NX720_19210 [Endozoicomonas euniceicola]